MTELSISFDFKFGNCLRVFPTAKKVNIYIHFFAERLKRDIDCISLSVCYITRFYYIRHGLVEPALYNAYGGRSCLHETQRKGQSRKQFGPLIVNIELSYPSLIVSQRHHVNERPFNGAMLDARCLCDVAIAMRRRHIHSILYPSQADAASTRPFGASRAFTCESRPFSLADACIAAHPPHTALQQHIKTCMFTLVYQPCYNGVYWYLYTIMCPHRHSGRTKREKRNNG